MWSKDRRFFAVDADWTVQANGSHREFWTFASWATPYAITVAAGKK